MNSSNESESCGVSCVANSKADDEELYRMKIVALQEYYDSVQLQTLRLRERIYNVRKQCRRLEGMKRAALNLLRYYTGTYEIPPLEIVDEDPVPSFLESLQKQQLVTTEAPRKKPKRSFRSKADSKLTPEEEERAKQKICSIIDSVYSETARRMNETPRSSFRCSCVNRGALLKSANVLKKGRNLYETVFKHFDAENLKADKSNIDAEELGDEENHSNGSTVSLNAHSETTNMGNEEQEMKTITPYDDTELNHSHDSHVDQNCSRDDEGKSNQPISYHNITAPLYNGMPEYGDNVEEVQDVSFGADSINNLFNASLDAVQHENHNASCSTVENNSYLGNDSHVVSCGSLHDVAENAVVYTNAMNCANTSISAKLANCNENVDPLKLFDYSVILNAGHPMNDANFTKPDPNYPAHLSMPLNYEDIVTTQAEIISVDESVPSDVVNAEKSESEQTKTEVPSPFKMWPESGQVKQEAQKSTSNDKASDVTLPNFIPYRMITVENPKPVEVVMVDPSGGEVSSSKQLLPKRRRKYKYVVESVLDNVPYTFRQAESDDDESNGGNSATTKTSLNEN